MINQSLLNLLESVLGKGKETANNNYSFVCPNCINERARLGKSKKNKLEIQLVTNLKKENSYHCWFCHIRGKTIKSLFKKLKLPQSKIDELSKIIKPTYNEVRKDDILELPKEFIPLSTAPQNLFYKRAMGYLRNRGVSSYDITRYNIGYCNDGPYSDRIIVPSLDLNGDLNYFIARSFENNPIQKYKNPKVSRDIIFNEFFINWDLPLVLCEGPFDFLAIKRNAIPLLGKTISDSLYKKIITSKVKKIYIALDSDAIKMALKHAEEFINKGKEIYLVELTDKDPSQLGFDKFTQIIQNTQPLTFAGLLNKKLEI
jgi:DNA primase